MSYSYRIKRSGNYEITTLDLSSPDFELGLTLISKLGKRERRAITLSFLRQIRPWFKHFTHQSINHNASGVSFNLRDQERKVKQFHTQPITSLAGRIGFEIRMQRLKIGLSQVLLAKAAGIKRPHLSKIERGLHHPFPQTIQKIKNALKEFEHL